MRKYCRAYPLRDMRQFPDWSESHLDGETVLTDDSIVYLWDDLTVVVSPIVSEKDVLWDSITSQWQRFCQDILHFEIPEDLHYAYEPQDQSISRQGQSNEV